MSYVERGFCGLEEFEKGKEGRLRETDIAVNEIYLAMFALDSAVAGRQAAKWPIRLQEKEESDQTSGLYIVRFAFIKKDDSDGFAPLVQSFDGLLIDNKKKIKIPDPDKKRRFPIKLGYFQNRPATKDDGPEREAEDARSRKVELVTMVC